MAIARARLLGEERRLLVAAGPRGSRRAAGALLDAIAVVEGALVEGRLHVRRAHVQVIEPSDACLRCATQGIWLVAARGHSGLELVGRGLGAGRAVGIGSGHAAIQDGLTAVGTGLTGTEAGGAVPGILIQPISPQLPEVVRELLAGIVEALLGHGREGARPGDLESKAGERDEGGGGYGEASSHFRPPWSEYSPWTGTVVPPWMTGRAATE